MKDSTVGLGRIKFFHNSRAVSCLGCQRRKRKCTRESPACGYCKNHGQACVYEKQENFALFASSTSKLKGKNIAKSVNTSVGNTQSDSDTLIASILIDVAQGKAQLNLTSPDAVGPTLFGQNSEKSKSLGDVIQSRKPDVIEAQPEQQIARIEELKSQEHLHLQYRDAKLLTPKPGTPILERAHSSPQTTIYENTPGERKGIEGHSILTPGIKDPKENWRVLQPTQGFTNNVSDNSFSLPSSQLSTQVEQQPSGINLSDSRQNAKSFGLSIPQKGPGSTPKWPLSLPLANSTSKGGGFLDKMNSRPIESLIGEEFHPPKKSLWPRQSSGPDPKPVTPEERVGPVATKIFNSSLNQQCNYVDKDLDRLISFMPNKDAADVLFARYHNSVHSIIPVFDWKAICPLYEMYWNDERSADLSFFTQIFAIFYAASVSLFEEAAFKKEGNIDSYIERMKYYMGATEIALSMSWFPRKVSFIGLQASVVLHGVVRNDCRTDDCGSVGNLIRLAQLLELNRDPVNYHEISDANEVQLRRILWWEILYLDTTTSLSTKLPPIIVQDEYDTLLPNEYYRDYNGHYQLDQLIAFSNGRFRWVECCNRILRRSFLLKPVNQAELNVLEKMIDDFAIQCSFSIEKITTSSNIKLSQELFVLFSSSVISTLADRCYILFSIVFPDELQKNYSRSFTATDCPGINLEKKKVIPDTSSIAKDAVIDNPKLIDNQIHLLHEFTKHGSMPKYIPYLWELRKFQPIQTVLSLMRNLIIDLRLRQSSTMSRDDLIFLTADKRVKCIDETLQHLSYLSELTTPLCKERWQLLRDLRKKIDDLIGSFETFESPSFVSSTPSDKAFSELDSKSSTESAYGYWDKLDQELVDFQKIVEENMNLKIWDDASGHFVS